MFSLWRKLKLYIACKCWLPLSHMHFRESDQSVLHVSLSTHASGETPRQTDVADTLHGLSEGYVNTPHTQRCSYTNQSLAVPFIFRLWCPPTLPEDLRRERSCRHCVNITVLHINININRPGNCGRFSHCSKKWSSWEFVRQQD